MALKFESIRSYDHNDYSLVDGDNISVFFYGEALDQRGEVATALLNQAMLSYAITFDPNTNSLNLNDEISLFGFEFTDFLRGLAPTNILIDATTLSIAEILLILHACNSIADPSLLIKILYFEPQEYAGKQSKTNANNVDYTLSNNLGGYYNIRPFSLLIDSTNPDSRAEVVVLLGFEDSRLGRLIKFDESHKYAYYTPLLGLPAFQPGWENITLAKNVRHFAHNFKNIEYAGATNPYQTSSVLKKIYDNRECKNMLIAAFGTKPCAIGAAVFLVNNFKEKNSDLGIIYDFPRKKANRTFGIGKMHLYSLVYKIS